MPDAPGFMGLTDGPEHGPNGQGDRAHNPDYERPLYGESPQRAEPPGQERGDVGDNSPFGEAAQRAANAAREDPHAQRIRELQDDLTNLRGQVDIIAGDQPFMARFAEHLKGALENLGGMDAYPSHASSIERNLRDVIRSARAMVSRAQSEIKDLGNQIGRAESELASLRANPDQMTPESPVGNPDQERIDEIARELENVQNTLPRISGR